MTSARLGARAWLVLLLASLLAACATPTQPKPEASVQAWSGRLALTVEGKASQSFAGSFELKGSATSGELRLATPFGGTAALLSWSPGSATLRVGNETRQFASLEELALAATGAPLPVAALFDWLRGEATAVPGWQVDVRQVAQGHLRAQRSEPAPPVELRIAFER